MMKKLLALALVGGLLAGNLSFAYTTPVRNWGDAGKVIANAEGPVAQFYPVACRSSDGYTLAAWLDTRGGDAASGYFQVYVQKLDSSGNGQWNASTFGVPIATGYASWTADLAIVPDAAGGAIVSWRDMRNGREEIYAQRVDGSGTVQWTAGGLAVLSANTALNYISLSRMIADGSGGAIICWGDDRNQAWKTDLYVQKIRSDGTVQWTADGLELFSSTYSKTQQQLASDGAGGAVVVACAPSNGIDIIALRVKIDGTVWVKDICNANNDQEKPQIVGDGQGNYLIVWQDNRAASWGQTDIYAQKINGSGDKQWIGAGDAMPVCTATNTQTDPKFVLDSTGTGMIVTWSDLRNGTDQNIYAQRLQTTNGGASWANNGVAVCSDTAPQMFPNIISDGSGGAIINWEDSRSDQINYYSELYGQRINSNGLPVWAADGVKFSQGTNQYYYNDYLARPVSDGANGAVALWCDYAHDSNGDIYGQRIKADGTAGWGAAGKVVCAGNGPSGQDQPVIGGDRVIAWRDWRDGRQDIYVQKFSANGDRLWGTDGKAAVTDAMLSLTYSTRALGNLCQTGNNYALVWAEDRSGSGQLSIYGQLFDSNGTALWQAGGLPIANPKLSLAAPTVAPDGAGGILVAWGVSVIGQTQNLIYAKRLAANGTFVWGGDAATTSGPGLPLTTSGFNVTQAMPAIANVGNGSAVAVWQDNRNDPLAGTTDIYGQKLAISDGTTQWDAAGAAICNAAASQLTPCISSLGDGQAVVGWSDARAGRVFGGKVGANTVKAAFGGEVVGPTLCDLYAQKLICSGSSPAPQWSANGLAVVAESANKSTDLPKVTLDPEGNAIFAFVDYDYSTSLGDIQVQALDPAGQKHLAAPFTVALGSLAEYSPGIIIGSDGTAYVSWCPGSGRGAVAQAAAVKTNSKLKAATVKAAMAAPASNDILVQALAGIVPVGGGQPGVSSSTTTTSTTTTTGGTTTTTVLTVVPKVDQVANRFKFAAPTIKAESNTLIGSNLMSGATIKFINRKTLQTLVAKNVVVAADGQTATFSLDLPAKTQTDAIGLYDVQVTNPNGGSYTLANAFRLEYPEGEIFFYPTKVNQRIFKATAAGTQPRIAYSLAEDKPIDIFVYDVRNMKVVYHRKFAAGTDGAKQGYNEVFWNGQTDLGGAIANGSYVLQAFSNGKMIGQTYFVVVE